MFKFLKQHFYKILYPLAQVWWFITRPKTRGVKCLIEHNGRFLLVKFAYAHKSWSLPGGGVNRRETPEDAVRREIMEELDIRLSSVQKIGEFVSSVSYKKDTVYCFYSQISDSGFKVDAKELSEAGWFERGALPEGYKPAVDYLFEMYDEFKSKKS